MRASVALLVAAVSFFPLATADSGDDVCRRECRPADPDVNGTNVTTEGPVRLILYAHAELNELGRPWSPRLTTQLPAASSDPEDARYPGGSSLGRSAPQPDLESIFTAFAHQGFEREFIPGGFAYSGLPSTLNFGAGPVVGFVYLSVNQGPDEAPSAPVPVQIESRLTTRDDGGEDVIVAQGTVDFTPSASARPNLGEEVRIPMDVLADAIPARSRTSWFIWIRTLSVADDDLAQPLWQLHVGTEYPARLILPVIQPLSSLDSDLLDLNEFPRFSWSIGTVFGPYDLDPSTARLLLVADEGPRPAPFEDFRPRYDISHGGDSEPVNLTWFLAPETVAAVRAGARLQAEVLNLQGTYGVRTSVDPGDLVDGGSGTLPLPLLVPVLALGLAVWRRRQLTP